MGWFKRSAKVASGVSGAALEVAQTVAPKILDAWARVGEGHTGKKEKEIILQQALYEHLKSEGGMFYDFFLAYEGSASDQHPIIKVIRGLVRPVLTLWFVGLFSYLLWQFMDVGVERMDVYLLALKLTFMACAIVLAFWFGDRSGFIKGMVESFTTWAKHRPGNGKGGEE